MTILENNVKYSKIIVFDHNFNGKIQTFLQIFVPAVGLLWKKFVSDAGLLNRKFSGPGVSCWEVEPFKFLPS